MCSPWRRGSKPAGEGVGKGRVPHPRAAFVQGCEKIEREQAKINCLQSNLLRGWLQNQQIRRIFYDRGSVWRRNMTEK
ncbi:hypothetical protein C3369_08770 [Escherichia sp. ESNIH1]|nr:hypothetical protein C3369_08770 [Escherichia sp. ESNIH1]